MSSSNPKQNEPEVLEPEIVEQGDYGRKRQWGGQGNGYRVYYSSPQAGNFWTVGNVYSGGCMGPAITCGIFLLLMAQFGLLAGIGFMVFYVIGGVLGTIYQARRLVEGVVTNPWTWRIWNWAISLLLTVWLAGGFND